MAGGTDIFATKSGSSGGGSSGGTDIFATTAKTSGGNSGSGKLGGGFLGGLEHVVTGGAHWVGQKSELAAHDIEATPGGLYQLGKGEVAAWKQTIKHPWVTGSQKQALLHDWQHPMSTQQAQVDKPVAPFVQGSVRSTVEAVKHPLRDPFLTLTTVLPVGHGIASGLVRVSRAARALDAGDFAGAAKHLASTPEMPQRTLQVPGSDKPVSLHASQNPLARGVQALYDKAMQKALERNPGGRFAGHAIKRLAGASVETTRRTVRMGDVDANMLDQTARKLGRKALGQRRLREAALELTSTQTTPEEAAAYHDAQAAKGVSVALNRRVADIYRKVGEAGMLKVQDGRVVVDAEAHPALARADAQLAKVQQAGDRLLAEHGLMSEQGLETRRNAPGRIRNVQQRPGRGFVSYKPAETAPPKTPVAQARTSAGAIGEARKPINSKKFTGKMVETGQVPTDVTGQASRHYRSLLRYHNTIAQRQQLADQFGHDFRVSQHDRLIRIPGAKGAKLSAEMEQLIGRKRGTVETAESADKALADLEHSESVANATVDQTIGTPAPKGFKWVDERVGKATDLNAEPRRGAAKVMDEINSLITTATVYTKPGHAATRYLTNLATNVVQGSWKDAVRNRNLWNQLSQRDRLRALAASGQHGFQAMPHEGRTVFARMATKGANAWAKYADAAFRFNALAYEARKAGFADTPAAFTSFLDKLESNGHGMSAAEWAKVDWVAKRADRAAIAYDRISPGERQTLARLIWFYPWAKGSGMFVGHTLVEHPYKSAVLTAAGKQGEEQQQNIFGALPSYEMSLVPLGGKGPSPLTTSFETFTPTSGATQLLDAIARPSSLGGDANPMVAALLAALYAPPGMNPKTPLRNALEQLVTFTPEAQIVANATRHSTKPTMFPKTVRAAVLRALLGPATPRPVDVAKLNQARGLELSGR